MRSGCGPRPGHVDTQRCYCIRTDKCAHPTLERTNSSWFLGRDSGIGTHLPLDWSPLHLDHPGLGLDCPGLHLDHPGLLVERPGLHVDPPGQEIRESLSWMQILSTEKENITFSFVVNVYIIFLKFAFGFITVVALASCLKGGINLYLC